MEKKISFGRIDEAFGKLIFSLLLRDISDAKSMIAALISRPE